MKKEGGMRLIHLLGGEPAKDRRARRPPVVVGSGNHSLDRSFFLSPVGELNKEQTMDKDRIKGSAKQVKGAVKEAVGKVTGDAKLQADGSAEKAAGKVQNAVGGIKDTLRGK